MSQIEAVFFDCDGTLVDSEVICSRAYVTMFQEFGITLDPEEVFKRFKGVKLYEIIDIVSLEHGVTLAKTEAEHVYRAEVARLFDSELEAIEGALGHSRHHVLLCIPYSQGGLVDTLHKNAQVLSVDYTGDGIVVDTILDPILYGKLREMITKEC